MENYHSKQITRSAEIKLNADIDEVFPLFSPKGEMLWVTGWEPTFLFPQEGEPWDMLVFKTKASNLHENEFLWTTSHLDFENKLVVYTVFTDNRVWTIKVRCKCLIDNRTSTEISYTFTSLNSLGEEVNKAALDKMYQHNLKDWEEAINHYLINGTKINV